MTEEPAHPKPKRPRSDKQKANDARLKAYWTEVHKNGSKPRSNEVQAGSKPGPKEETSDSKPHSNEVQTDSKPAQSSSHPSIPPKASQDKEAPSPPKKKPFRLLW